MQYVGLDIHKRVCYATVLDGNGNIVKQGKFLNGNMEVFFADIEGTKVAIESCSFWQPCYEWLESRGRNVNKHLLGLFRANKISRKEGSGLIPHKWFIDESNYFTQRRNDLSSFFNLPSFIS